MERSGGDVAAIDALLPALKRREHDAFHDLHDLLAGQLLAYAHARVGDRATAEDVIQDVFLKLARHARRFRGDGRALLAWMYKATRRRCTDVHRKRARRQEQLLAVVPDEAVPEAGLYPSFDPVLEAALAELTEDQREAVLLRRVAGLDGAEVATIMKRDREAVYALCARAEARLRVRITLAALPAGPSMTTIEEDSASDEVPASDGRTPASAASDPPKPRRRTR